jgi:hypothetical protein
VGGAAADPAMWDFCGDAAVREAASGPRSPPRAQPRAVGLWVPGPDPEVAIDPAGRLTIDPHDPVLAALAPDIDLRRCGARVAPAGIIGVMADPGQLGQPDPDARNTASILLDVKVAGPFGARRLTLVGLGLFTALCGLSNDAATMLAGPRPTSTRADCHRCARTGPRSA